MENIEQILRCIDYIEKNLKHEIKVKDLADFAGYSVFHFIRVFNDVTRYSPKDYILKRKIASASKELLLNHSTILELALEYGFNSHESFSRAFKRVSGLTPSEYKKNTYKDIIFTNMLTREYLEFLDTFKFASPTRVEFDGMTLRGISDILDLNELTKSKINEYLDYIDSLKSAYLVFDNYSYDKKSIFVGEGSCDRSLSMYLPSGEYAEFKSIEDAKQLPSLIKYAYEVWLPNSGFIIDQAVKVFRVRRCEDNLKLSLMIKVKELDCQ